jgi:hypothetical protein
VHRAGAADAAAADGTQGENQSSHARSILMIHFLFVWTHVHGYWVVKICFMARIVGDFAEFRVLVGRCLLVIDHACYWTEYAVS